jgi:hypothetical protein
MNPMRYALAPSSLNVKMSLCHIWFGVARSKPFPVKRTPHFLRAGRKKKHPAQELGYPFDPKLGVLPLERSDPLLDDGVTSLFAFTALTVTLQPGFPLLPVLPAPIVYAAGVDPDLLRNNRHRNAFLKVKLYYFQLFPRIPMPFFGASTPRGRSFLLPYPFHKVTLLPLFIWISQSRVLPYYYVFTVSLSGS